VWVSVALATVETKGSYTTYSPVHTLLSALHPSSPHGNRCTYHLIRPANTFVNPDPGTSATVVGTRGEIGSIEGLELARGGIVLCREHGEVFGARGACVSLVGDRKRRPATSRRDGACKFPQRSRCPTDPVRSRSWRERE